MISPWTILSLRLVTKRSYPSLPTLLSLSSRSYRSCVVSPAGIAAGTMGGWRGRGSGVEAVTLAATALILLTAVSYDARTASRASEPAAEAVEGR